MNDWDDATCSRCGKPFSEEEWDERHDDRGADCHARCCPMCKNDYKETK